MTAPYGPPFWDNPECYHIQDNNPTEHLLRVRSTGRGWLETCGPTAAVNCLSVLGAPLGILAPGEYRPQPEEVLSDFFHDSRNFSSLRKAWPDLDPGTVAGNEVAQWYPWAIKKVFGMPRCTFEGRVTVRQAMDFLDRGQALQVCLVDPGHFVSVVAYAPDEEAFIINDPWAGRWPSGTGLHQRLSIREFEENTKPVTLAYA